MRTVVTRRTASATKASAPAFWQVVEGARPTEGARLYAHTHAVLLFLGLFEGKGAMRRAVEALMGERAVSYHLRRENFSQAANSKIKLTTRGRKVFSARQATDLFDPSLANAFLVAISQGRGSVEHSIGKGDLHPVRDIVLS